MTLPGGADHGKIDAALDDGMLTVTVPKSKQQAQSHHIEVKDS